MFTSVKPKWFKGYNTAEEVKKRYRDLCKMYHPDLHPGEEFEAFMKEINAEYDSVWEQAKNTHTADPNAGYTREKASSVEFEHKPEFIRKVISKLVCCEGLQIDIVGTWIWVMGQTFTYKQTLKDLGFKWSSTKKAWYLKPDDSPAARYKKMSLEEIKTKYGCESFVTDSVLKLA